MKVITVLSAKGGAGKSSLSLGLAAGLARHSKVAIGDLDSFNRTVSNFFFDPSKPTLLNVLSGELSLREAAYEVRENLHLIAGNGALARVDRIETADAWHRLRAAVGMSVVGDDFDYLVLDCPAGWHLQAEMAAQCAIDARDNGLCLLPVASSGESLESGNTTALQIMEMLPAGKAERKRALGRLKFVLTMRPTGWAESEDAEQFAAFSLPELSWLDSQIQYTKLAPKLAKASLTPFDDPTAWRLSRSYAALSEEIEAAFSGKQ